MNLKESLRGFKKEKYESKLMRHWLSWLFIAAFGLNKTVIFEGLSMGGGIKSFKTIYYTSPEICLYKSNTLDWYVNPRDKMKNITYGYANERAGLITHAQFVWIKILRHINYAVAHAQCLRQHV